MLRAFLCLVSIAATCLSLVAGERVFDFSKYPLDKQPYGFRSLLSGTGKLGDWKVIADPNSPKGEGTNGPERVLAQLSPESTDEHFPMLMYDPETYGDFTLTTRFKLVDGLFEQMAGIAFRVQDTNNYYYVRASALGNNFRFIKLVDGQRLVTVGPSLEIKKGVWHDLSVTCNGNRISFLFDGKEVIPPLNDNSFVAGRFAFWTKSDSIAYFGKTTIQFTPHETLAQIIVREAKTRYPRLEGLRVYARALEDDPPKVIASTYADEVGLEGGHVEKDVIARDTIYYGKDKGVALVTMPLHDRNGEVVGAVRIILESFPGQTEDNAVARARPIVKDMESRIRNGKDLFE